MLRLTVFKEGTQHQPKNLTNRTKKEIIKWNVIIVKEI